MLARARPQRKIVRWNRGDRYAATKLKARRYSNGVSKNRDLYLEGCFGNESLAALIAPMILLRSTGPPALRNIVADDRVVIIIIAVYNIPLGQLLFLPRLFFRPLRVQAREAIALIARLDRVAQPADGVRDLRPLRRVGKDLSQIASLPIGVRRNGIAAR